MTVEEFFTELASGKEAYVFNVDQKQRIRNAFDECPICAVANSLRCTEKDYEPYSNFQFRSAAAYLKLSTTDCNYIAIAADSHAGVKYRNRLLDLCKNGST